KEQKDVELDKKILALRKKNEALIRRYQEIEEDKKRAEQEGMAVTSRRPKQDGLTITITKAHNDKRVVSEKWASPCPKSPGFGIGSEEEEEEEEADHMFTFRMGKRMQLAVTMDNKAKVSREEDSTLTRTLNVAVPGSFINQKLFSLSQDGGKSVQKSPGDLSFPLTGRERSEYMRWKREREQIDLERLARHKNAKGEWRRAWDVEKS
ncbi:CCD9B protein, partial [Tachuris rubrigastra]|nr:CCD9B protein [Tachuris rubrigastra]